MKKKLNILLIADPELPVPPALYGGIERVIDMLLVEYTKLGHQVSLIAHPESNSKVNLFAYPKIEMNSKLNLVQNTIFVNRTILKGNFDLVHSFARLILLLPHLPFSIPKIMSYQREPTLTQIKRANNLAKKNTLVFTGCSAYISNQIKQVATAFPIFNGVDLCKYQATTKVNDDAPLVFLGRIEPIKGTHIAIQVAKATQNKLIIAGNIPSEYMSYFKTEVEPHLDENIHYIGPINDVQKNELLGSAKAFLMPILWNEPFGIVMAEAMACGTPVIGFNRGSVPEVVKQGLNGFRCETPDEMITYINKLDEINRKQVREDAEERFSAEVIAMQYLTLYENMISMDFSKMS